MTTIAVDIDTLLGAVAAAPSYRAVAGVELRTTPSTPYYGRRYRVQQRRTGAALYDGNKMVPTISEGSVVLIDTSSGWWRITRSKTGEPTPNIITMNGAGIPQMHERVSESTPFTIYTTPHSILTAAMYQHENHRSTIALAMMNQAILLRAKKSLPATVAKMEKTYARFRKTAALAIAPGTEGEGVAALVAAIKTGVNLIQGNTD